MIKYKHVALIGLGLIASSIALAIKRKNSNVIITGTSRSKKTRILAKELKICQVFDNIRDTVKNADLVILCVPVGAMSAVSKELKNNLKKGSTITDVGSVKKRVISQINPFLPDDIFFIPGHPLAGTEESGPQAGISDLFEGRWCILTPDNTVPKSEVKKLESFWVSLGSMVRYMTPDHHDLVLAVTSHAPHLIAYTMVGVADDFSKISNSEVINYSAAGFRDFTRIAASDPTMWRDVFLNNKEASLEILGRFNEELFALQSAIRNGDGDFLYEYFKRTRKIRRSIIDAGQDTKEINFGRYQKKSSNL